MVPFVDNLPNSPICEGGDSANKAMEVNYLVSKDNICVFWKVYELVYLEQNLFEREDVIQANLPGNPPICPRRKKKNT